MIYPMNRLSSKGVGGILNKVDDTLIVIVQSELFLPHSQITDEISHPYDFLAGFDDNHILCFYGR